MRVFTLLGILLLTFGTFAADANAQETTKPGTPATGTPATAAATTPAAPSAEDEQSTKEKASYILGFSMMSRINAQGMEVDLEQLIDGIKKAQSGEAIGMESDEIRSVQMAFQANERKRITAKVAAQGEANKAEGTKFIAEFAAQEKVMELEDGVKYMVLNAGTGEAPADQDRVKVHYEGKYTNGEVFDSSIAKGEPLTLGVNQFVPGFSAALKKMKVGDKWKVAIRGDKGYGARPPRGMEPFKTMVFEIELLEVVKPNAEMAPKAPEAPKAPNAPNAPSITPGKAGTPGK